MRTKSRRIHWLVALVTIAWMGSTPAAAFTLDWTAGLGGFIEDMAVDAEGNTYFVSNHESYDPVTGYEAGFIVTKLDREGDLVFSRDFSFAVWVERARAIALDPAGFIYVTGVRNDEPQSEFGEGFVLKLDSTASAVVYYKTFWESFHTVAEDVAVDPQGRAYAILSSDYRYYYSLWRLSADGSQAERFGPDLSAALRAVGIGPGGDVFVAGEAMVDGYIYSGGLVARLTSSGSLVYRTELEESGLYFPLAITVGAGGAAYIAGSIQSSYDPVDAFAARIDAAGNLAGARVLGGSGQDIAWSVAVALSGDVLVGGRTMSADFPVQAPLQGECSPQQAGCEGDGFLTRLDGALSEIRESTYFGGSASDVILSVGTDGQGAFYLGGNSQSPDLPGGGGPGGFAARIALDNQAPDCSAAAASPSRIVPATGEFVPVSVSGVTDPDGDPVDLMFTAIRQDEPIGGGEPDATGVGTATARVRASRYGLGDGRVYHLKFRATDPEGSTCSGEVTVCVPLNSGSPGCGDGGALVDSTSPRPRNASLLWSTFLGGIGDEMKLADVEIDASGHAWIAGTTASEDYPVLKGQPPNGYDDEYFFLDAFVSRVTPNGALERSGYSGEYYSDDFVEDLAIGPDGTTWLAGWYESYEDVEVIVSRTAQGRSVGGSFQFFNGEEVDLAFAVATDREGNAYIAGSSGSHWFAGTGVYIENRVGNYVLKLGPDGQFQKLFVLPERRGQASAVAVDAAGNLYVAGSDGSEVWVLKLDPAGNLLWQTDVGGSQDETATSIAVDTSGRVWVAGWSESPDFPVRGGRVHAGGRDAFLVRLTAGGALDVSTLFGGAGTDEAQDLTLDGLGRPYLAGLTSSADFPLSGPLVGSCGAGRECGAGSDAFAAAFDIYATSNLVLTFATRLGGGSPDGAHGVAVTPAGTYLWVSGLTRSVDFQTLKPWQPALAGEGDAFVAKLILSGR